MTDPRSRSASFRFALALILASVLAAGFAIVVRVAISATSESVLGAPDVLSAFRQMPWWARMIAPAIGALLGGIVGWAATRLPESRGVGDVLEAVVLGRRRISLRAALAKSAASFFAIVSGGSLGREGPIIQVGAALAGASAKIFGLSPSRTRILFAAGAAAGFGAAYNTPLAASLFVIEIVTGVVALDVIVPVIIATAIATTVSRLTLGEGPFYGLRTYALVTPTQLASSIVLGPLGGLVAVAFMEMLSRCESFFGRTVRPLPLRAAAGGLVVGLMAIRLPEITGNGAESIREMLDGRVLGVTFAALLVGKALATTASVSTGSAGGVFTPSMFLGAALGGGIASMFLGGVSADHSPVVGAFALVGMASVVAATTHAPLMASVLAFEMSGDYALVIPLLVTTALATGTARLLRRDSIYTGELRRKGVSWDGSIAHRLARAVHARDLLEPALVLDPATTVERVLAELTAHRARVAYCVVEGKVLSTDFRQLASASAADRARTFGATAVATRALGLDDDLPVLAEHLWTQEWGEAPVLDASSHVVGIVTRRALLGALDRELLQRDLLLTRMTWTEAGAGALIELPRGYRMGVVPAPATSGALDVLAIRARHGVWVVAVRAEGARVPWKDSFGAPEIAPGDRWLVVGERAAVDVLERAGAESV